MRLEARKSWPRRTASSWFWGGADRSGRHALLAARAPAITAANLRFKTRFIDIHDIGRAAFCDDTAQCTQIG